MCLNDLSRLSLMLDTVSYVHGWLVLLVDAQPWQHLYKLVKSLIRILFAKIEINIKLMSGTSATYTFSAKNHP